MSPVVVNAVRWGLPAVLMLVGLALIAFGGRAGLHAGAMLWGGAGVAITASILFRIGASGDRDRAEEEEARRFFDRHGHWPDEAPEKSEERAGPALRRS